MVYVYCPRPTAERVSCGVINNVKNYANGFNIRFHFAWRIDGALCLVPIFEREIDLIHRHYIRHLMMVCLPGIPQLQVLQSSLALAIWGEKEFSTHNVMHYDSWEEQGVTHVG